MKTFENAKKVYILTGLITGSELLATIRTIPTVLSRAQSQFFIGSLLLALESLPKNVFLDAQDSTRFGKNLWGKSQCEVAESVIRKQQNTSSWTGSEAEVPKCGLRWSSSQLHNHAVSAHLRASTDSQKSAFSEFEVFFVFSSSEKSKTSPLVSAHPS